jgi:hypothetical protein
METAVIVDIDTFQHSTRVIPKSRSCTFLSAGFVIVVRIYHLSTPGTASHLLQLRQDGPHCIFNIVVQIPIYICRKYYAFGQLSPIIFLSVCLITFCGKILAVP